MMFFYTAKSQRRMAVQYDTLRQWCCFEWWHPGQGFVMSPFFGPEIGEDQKKKVFAEQLLVFGANEVGDQRK